MRNAYDILEERGLVKQCSHPEELRELMLVRKVAPLGDPLELTVRGYELSVRKSDAELIEVE